MIIYALCEPGVNEIRYIGKTINLKERLSGHKREKGTTRKIRWLAKLKREGKEPKLLILEEILDEDWESKEKKWISYYHKRGNDLLNHTDGGEGVQNPSQESREKLSRSRKKLWESNRDYYLKILQDPERCLKISNALSGKKKAPAHIAKLPQNQKGFKHSKEFRHKISTAMKGNQFALGKQHSDETKRKISMKLKGNKHTLGHKVSPETRRKISVAMKGRFTSLETRLRMRQARFRFWARKRRENELRQAL